MTADDIIKIARGVTPNLMWLILYWHLAPRIIDSLYNLTDNLVQIAAIYWF